MQTRDSKEAARGIQFVPWIVIGIIALIYLITLNRWVGDDNLPSLARINGWDWQPLSTSPVHFLVTLPIRILPVTLQPVALSLLSAICSLLSLCCLARTVVLLPQERTRLQRQRHLGNAGTLLPQYAWLPATLAVLLCGLQLTYWQSSSGFSTAILDLLLLAYPIRALAEFRVDQRDSWLHKAALVFGLGITENFAMIAYLPLFIGAVAWIKGSSFFNFSFLTRFCLMGTLGLLCYLVIPISHSLSGISTFGFWGSLRGYLGLQKHALFSYRRVTAILLSVVSVIPLLGLTFRWGEGGGDISGASHKITAWLTHFVHGVFLALCIAAAFEFPMANVEGGELSVRSMAAAARDPIVLSVYFLGAVSVGYYAGYFLSVFGTPSLHKWNRTSGLEKGFATAVVGLLFALLIAVPALLLYRNLPKRLAAHSPALERIARRIGELVPKGGATISDSPVWHYLAHYSSYLVPDRASTIHVDSASLPFPSYHARMKSRFSQQWPALPKEYPLTATIEQGVINQLLTRFALSNQVYYTEPSFGYFFEAHYLEPQGLVYRFHPLPLTRYDVPPPSADQIQKSEAYWKQLGSSDFPPLLKSLPKGKDEQPADVGAAIARSAYSRALNQWGVSLQRSGYKDQAGDYFKRSLELNPKNGCAYVNSAYNQQIRTNGNIFVAPTETMTNLFRAMGGVERLLSINGPLDETGNLLMVGQMFAGAQLYLQAAQLLQVVADRTPTSPEPKIAVAKMLVEAGRPDFALGLVENLRKTIDPRIIAGPAIQMDLLDLESRATDRNGDPAKAEAMLKQAIDRYPNEDTPYSTLVSLYVQKAASQFRRGQTADFEQYVGKARVILEQQLTRQPTNSSAWINYGASFMRLDMHTNAIPALSRALQIDKENTTALLNRAICYFKTGQYVPAQQDYELVRRLIPDSPYQVFYGLGEIALRNGRKKEAVGFYEEYLKRSPDSKEAKDVREKLAKLK